jgi:ABC-type Mn2+/Zn2+ transport system ATPase subunit
MSEGKMTASVIEFRNVTLGYGRRVVVRDISFTIDSGDYLGLVGPNGAGKTTIIRSILGTLPPLAGSVRIGVGGKDRVHVGYVPQRDSIDSVLPYTAREVVLMGRYRQIGLMRRPAAEDRAITDQALAYAEARGFADAPFRDLSGGQKQRVLIARALATQPEVLILDEPTNGMDLSSRLSILQLIAYLHDEQRLTVIMVSHLLDDVANHVRRLAIVQQGVFQIGEVDEILTGPNLSSLYQRPIEVVRIGSHTAILPGGNRESS